MPQNTPMKRQFTTIDGRTVMSNLPQHWGGNDWAITGVDNPLPVGNYIQTDSGVWIPQKGSDNGAADVRLTRSIEVLAIDARLTNFINMTAGSSITILENNKKRTEFKELRYGVRFSQATDSRIVLQFYTKESPSFQLGTVSAEGGIAHTGVLSSVNTPFFQISIHNDSSGDRELMNYVIIGVR